MSFDRKSLTNEEQAALEIIQGHRAIISMHADISWIDNDLDKPVYDPADADALVDQLYDPNTYRPSLSAAFFANKNLPRPDKLIKTNMKTGEQYEITPGECRNTKHKGIEFQHTAKTATTLLPPEPEYMMVFGNDLIGYLWDINACDLKDERYVWETDGGSDLCYWLSPNPNHPTPDDIIPVAPISKLRENNLAAINAKKTIWWNELDIGLPKRRIDAMFASRDTLELRLRTWNQMLRDKKRIQFEKDIPLFVIQSDRQDGLGAVFRVYDASERAEDLKSAVAILQNPPSDTPTYRLNLLRTVVKELTDGLNSNKSLKQNYHGVLFKSVVQSEKAKLRTAIKDGIKQLDEEIKSWVPYPNKDRKNLKLAALKEIDKLFSKPAKLLSYIATLEKEQSPVLQGYFSKRTYNLLIKVKQIAGSETQKKQNERSARITP